MRFSCSCSIFCNAYASSFRLFQLAGLLSINKIRFAQFFFSVLGCIVLIEITWDTCTGSGSVRAKRRKRRRHPTLPVLSIPSRIYRPLSLCHPAVPLLVNWCWHHLLTSDCPAHRNFRLDDEESVSKTSDAKCLHVTTFELLAFGNGSIFNLVPLIITIKPIRGGRPKFAPSTCQRSIDWLVVHPTSLLRAGFMLHLLSLGLAFTLRSHPLILLYGKQEWY